MTNVATQPNQPTRTRPSRPRVPMLRVAEHEARVVLGKIDQILLPMTGAIDYETCQLLGLRNRLLSPKLEVPARAWDTISSTLHRYWPGTEDDQLHLVDEALASELAAGLETYLRTWHFERSVVWEMDMLAAEGLLWVLRMGPQALSGKCVLDLMLEVTGGYDDLRAAGLMLDI